jgi:gag-polypeptide of LTR copia-type
MECAVMTYLPKLTGNNWYEWKKEVETYFMLIGCRVHVGSEKPGGAKASEWEALDEKVYAMIWFLVDPNYRSLIITMKSRKEAWAKLVSEYQKDSMTNRLLLRQQFYSIAHDPAVPVSTFIDNVFAIVQKLDAIGHKPSDLEVSDKILLGLD